jgi:hypothetical protein
MGGVSPTVICEPVTARTRPIASWPGRAGAGETGLFIAMFYATNLEIPLKRPRWRDINRSP